jgi:hypothetical protein
MSHVGDIGRGRGRGGFGEGTRIGPAPAAGGSQSSPDAGGLGEGGLEGGLEGGGEGLAEAGPGPTPSRTGERPRLGTAERPAFNNPGQPRTNTRPALPAATFADALTQDTKGTKASTAPATLVMPKVQTPEPPVTRGGKTREMPAFKEGADAPPDTDSPVGRNGTRIVKTSDVAASKTRPEDGKSGEPARKPEKDNFGTTAPTTGNRPAFRASQVKVPVRPVQELIPKNLDKLGDQASVAKRFASDLPLLNQQVRPSDLPPTDRALRMWAFFTAYAEAAAGQEPTPEGQEIFDKALEKEGFGELRDKHSGQDGVKAGKWVLQSTNPEEAKDRAGQVELEPPPEVLLSEAAKAQKQQKGQGPEAPKQDAQLKGQTPEAAPKQDAQLKGQPPEAAAKPEAQPKAQTPEAPAKTAPAKTPEAAPPTPDSAKTPEATPHPETAELQDSPHRLENAPRTSTPASKDLKDSAFTQASDRPPLERANGHSEFVRLNPQLANVPPPVILPPNPQLQKRQEEEVRPGGFEDAWKKLSGNLKLGGNMLWNVLHRMRNGQEDSAIEKEKWNQIAFAAVLAFVGLMLLVILVVSL